MGGQKDENDKLRDGQLSSDPLSDAERMRLRVVQPDERRTPDEPCDLETEKALLGALLWAGSHQPELLKVACLLDILPTGEFFYGRGHPEIFDAIRSCSESGVEHEPVSVNRVLVGLRSDRAAGGIDTLRSLVDGASTVNEKQARTYAEVVRQLWIKRGILRDVRLLAEDAKKPDATVSSLADRVQLLSQSMVERARTTGRSVSTKQSAEGFFKQLEAAKIPAMRTGLTELDNTLNGGLRPGEVSVLAARTNVGKSSLSAQIALNIVTNDPNVGALYVSLEMAHESFMGRMIAAHSGVPLSDLRKATLNQTQWSSVTASVMHLRDKGLYFTDSPSQTLSSIYSTALELARSLARDGKRLGLIVIDHIGLVKPSADALKRATREGQVAETSRGQRFLASRLNCHVLGIAQLSRASEQKGVEGIPKLHHIRESGSLEMDADTVMILHRERNMRTGLFSESKPPALVVAKSRLDEMNSMVLGYEAKRARFSDWIGPGGFSEFYGG